MGFDTKIEWCDHTWNPWRGCFKPHAHEDGTGVAPECFHCYAEAGAKRNPLVLGEWGKNARRAIAAESYWDLPFRWNRKAEKDGVRRRVFCLSLGDFFEDRDDLIEHRTRAFITIAQTPNLDWLILTKRPENIGKLWLGGIKENVCLGTSCGHPDSLWRVSQLLECYGLCKLLFVSAEPLLRGVDLTRVPRDIDGETVLYDALDGRWHPMKDGFDPGWAFERVEWVIVGGESGPKARPCDLGWIRSIRDQCRAAEVPVFIKQLGNKPVGANQEDGPTAFGMLLLDDPKGGDMTEWPEDLRIREFPV